MFLMHPQLRSADLRKQIRLCPTPTASTLLVKGEAPATVTVRDISRSGMGLSTPTAVPVGSVVTVICGTLAIAGTVQYCTTGESGGYLLGLVIDRVMNQRTQIEI